METRAVWISAVLLSLMAGTASAITFNDGSLHVIDAGNSYPAETVTVRDGPGPSATSIDVTTGGAVSTVSGNGIHAEGLSSVSITGGDVGADIQLSDTVILGMTSGSVTGGIYADDGSSVAIFGGTAGGVRLLGAGSAQILGGSIPGGVIPIEPGLPFFLPASVVIDDDASLTVQGASLGMGILGSVATSVDTYSITLDGSTVPGVQVGDFDSNIELTIVDSSLGSIDAEGVATFQLSGSSSVSGDATVQAVLADISGGSVTGTLDLSASTGLFTGGSFGDTVLMGSHTISGGIFAGTFELSGGTVDVTGGTIAGPITLLGSSQLTLVGLVFNFPPGPVGPTSGTVEGILQDGTPIEVDFARASTASLVIDSPGAAPVPALPGAGGLALALALAGTARVLARRRAR